MKRECLLNTPQCDLFLTLAALVSSGLIKMRTRHQHFLHQILPQNVQKKKDLTQTLHILFDHDKKRFSILNDNTLYYNANLDPTTPVAFLIDEIVSANNSSYSVYLLCAVNFIKTACCCIL